MNLIESNITGINTLCARHKVAKLFVFGSVIGKNFNESSDIDLLVDFKDVQPNDYADNYFDFKFSLEKLFSRPVDLLEQQALRNPYLKSAIDKSKKLIYG